VKLNTYWLDWQPEKVQKGLEHAPTEPTKPSSVSFVGADSTHFQNFSLLEAKPEEYEEGFSHWIFERCQFVERAWWGTGALYRDYCDWCARTGKDVPGNFNTFKALLQGSGFTNTDDGLVYGLALTEDLFRKTAARPPTKPVRGRQ
jgi:hypothetical protein